MLFKEMKPFARFVRRLEIDRNTTLREYIPLDCRIFFCIKGEGHILASGNEYILREGGFIYINAGQKYKHLPCDAVYIAVNFDFTQDNSDIEIPVPPVDSDSVTVNLLSFAEFEDAPCFNTHIYIERFHSLSSLLVSLEDEYVKKLPFYRIETANLLSSVLTKIARRCDSRPQNGARLNINSILEYINSHYDENITNNALSEYFNFHPNYISSEFKRQIGKPLHRYVLETRIYKAVSFIEAGHRNISELARLTGFSDSNYFSRYFKSVIGLSPAGYIKGYSDRENQPF